MTTTHPCLLLEGPYATYDLPTIDRATAYGMEVSTERRKFMVNTTNNFSADISMNGQK